MSLVHLRPGAEALRQALAGKIEGEIRFDEVSRALYSTDASVYQIDPLGVVVARIARRHRPCRRDCCTARLPDHHARRRHFAGRPGDRRRAHRRHVEILQPHLEVNADERWARVEPGIVLDELNAAA